MSIYDSIYTIVVKKEVIIIIKESHAVYSKFIEVVRLLASPPEQQINAFPSKTRVTDEIGIIFDECYRQQDLLMETEILDTSVVALLDEINSLFEHISKQPDLWSNTSLKSAEEWSGIRSKALKILTILNLEMKKPDLHWLHFVQ